MDNETLKEAFRTRMKESPGIQLYEVVAHGALHLEPSHVQTVSFLFWLSYMVETELQTVLVESWMSATNNVDRKVLIDVTESLRHFVEKEFSIADSKRIFGIIDVFDPASLTSLYFTDKIILYQAIMGKSNRTEVLWDLKDIRNDISHNRINNLLYNGQSLHRRDVQESLLMAYLETFITHDLSRSPVWTSASKRI